MSQKHLSLSKTDNYNSGKNKNKIERKKLATNSSEAMSNKQLSTIQSQPAIAPRVFETNKTLRVRCEISGWQVSCVLANHGLVGKEKVKLATRLHCDVQKLQRKVESVHFLELFSVSGHTILLIDMSE